MTATGRVSWRRGAGRSNGAVEDSVTEPPVPPGLKGLDGALESLAAFLLIDPDLLAAAAEASVARPAPSAGLGKWPAARPAREKDRWLLRAATDSSFSVGREVLRQYDAARKPASVRPGPRRTVAQLLARASTLRERPRRKR